TIIRREPCLSSWEEINNKNMYLLHPPCPLESLPLQRLLECIERPRPVGHAVLALRVHLGVGETALPVRLKHRVPPEHRGSRRGAGRHNAALHSALHHTHLHLCCRCPAVTIIYPRVSNV